MLHIDLKALQIISLMEYSTEMKFHWIKRLIAGLDGDLLLKPLHTNFFFIDMNLGILFILF